MAIVISIGFVELLNWISGLIASPRVVLNALVYNPLVDKGSQWTVFISSLEHDPLRTHVDRLIVYEGDMHNPFIGPNASPRN